MVKARRAQPRRARVVILTIVVSTVLAGGAAFAISVWPGAGGTADPAPGVLGTAATAPGSPTSNRSGASSATEAAPSPTSSTSQRNGESAARTELVGCRALIRAADTVLDEAEIGVGHWADHVQAQLDANAGKVTTNQMEATWKRTRLAGPADVRRYREAVKQLDEESGSCTALTGAADSIASAMKKCVQRGDAQQPVLIAAADAMADWQNHLAAMRRSAGGHVHDAQAVWVKAYRAAPSHLDAYADAVDHFDAPKC